MTVGSLRRFIWLGFFALLSLGCTKAHDPWQGVEGGPARVLVSFPPLYCFVKNVAGNHAAVLSVLGQKGPHDYHPTAADALKFRKADVFFYNGLDLDDFLLQLARSSGNSKLHSVNLGKLLPKKELLAMKEHDHSAEDGHAHHHHGEHDPHVWLGILEATQMVEEICKTLQDLPGTTTEMKDAFRRNANIYLAELKKLQEHGQQAFKDKKNKKLLTMHESLGYFARNFGLDIAGSIQIRPGMEGSPGRLAKIVELCKKENVPIIAVEPQYPQDAARLLQSQLGRLGANVEVVLVDPLETTAEQPTPGFYVEQMRKNIDTLAAKMP